MTAPDVSEAWLDDIFNAVVTEALACGWFERVNAHEPASSPGHGLTCAVWVQAGPDPMGNISGLDNSSGLLVLNVRIYAPSMSEPRDAIDPNVAKAVSALMRRWHDNYDFGLDPLVRNVDLYGQTGVRLSSRAGYVQEPGQAGASGRTYRVMTITLPIIVNDIWPIGS